MRATLTGSATRRWWLVGSALVVILVLALVAGARRRGLGDVPRLGPTALTLVPGIHLLGGLEPSAAYAVETPEGLVLVDSGLRDDAALLKAQLVALGLDGKQVRAILLTHAHGDHSGGAQSLRTETGAKVYAGSGDAGVLRAGTPREAFFSTFYMPDQSPHPTTIDVELQGGETLAFGDVRFQALATPGHTPGSICYRLDRGGVRALFGGDVISMLLGEADPEPLGKKPLGTYSTYLSPRFRGSARDYLASLRKLRALPVPDLVLPGHPRSDPAPQSPCLSEERWATILDQGIREMETLEARYRADGEDFLDGHPKTLLPGFYYLGDFRDEAVYGFVASSKFFLVDAPGGPGLLEFLEQRLRVLEVKAEPPFAVLLTSCNAKETAGLKDLVAKCQAQVVAAPGGVETARKLCPPGTVVIASEELPKKGWFAVKPIPLGGRGVAPVAYLLDWGGKSVLLSGRIPTLFDHPAMEALASDLSETRGSAIEYLLSIHHLDAIQPDLWLPAVPSDDQNANLYDRQWRSIIANNYRAGYSILQRQRGVPSTSAPAAVGSSASRSERGPTVAPGDRAQRTAASPIPKAVDEGG